MVVADCLSRPEEEDSCIQPLKIVSAVTCDPFDLQTIAEVQSQGFKEEMCKVYTQGTEIVTIPPDIELLCDNAFIPRPIVPPEFGENCSSIFTTCHIRTKVTSEVN